MQPPFGLLGPWFAVLLMRLLFRLGSRISAHRSIGLAILAAMNITETFAHGAQPISFEIFPPKGDLTLETAHEVARELSALEPDFISVTYSAGGSGNGGATTQIAHMIQAEFGVPVMAHLTCRGLTERTLFDRVADLKAKGIENVLALRGDRVDGCDVSEFPFAKDTIGVLVDEGFCVGAACYPEGHIECERLETSIEHLKQKQDAGASFFVSQLFFDNSCFYRFLEACRDANVTVPITAGIMPFLGKAQIQRMVFMCGASLPSPIIKLLAKYEDDAESLRKAGIEYACNQLVDLQAHGVDGLHVYTMNQPRIACDTVRALRAQRGAAFQKPCWR
ncbi:methylenetetrahydrofolate reductase [Raoultibacter phocaeensis]|uniref:methylenetetrahydrofolate reductase n=1 Tax=Raoultibacter phocaeensis TaxID=2479841 RepID=UPI002103AE7E|nr:methylenetetrahydrofolate reductase [Raoultibacter phocaeensis]